MKKNKPPIPDPSIADHRLDPACCRQWIEGRLAVTPRLRVRLLGPNDAGALFAILTDPQVSGMLSFAAQPYTLRQAEERCSRGWTAAHDGRALVLGVHDAATRLVGSCGIHALPDHGMAEIGYFFAHDCWGRGYAAEILTMIVAMTRRELRLRELIATTALDNRASQRVLERAGFRRQKEMASLLPQGGVRPSYMYALPL